MKTKKQHLKALQHRLEFLNRRIAESTDKDLSFDRAERSALEWAIKESTAADQAVTKLHGLVESIAHALKGTLQWGSQDAEVLRLQALIDDTIKKADKLASGE